MGIQVVKSSAKSREALALVPNFTHLVFRIYWELEPEMEFQGGRPKPSPSSILKWVWISNSLPLGTPSRARPTGRRTGPLSPKPPKNQKDQEMLKPEPLIWRGPIPSFLSELLVALSEKEVLQQSPQVGVVRAVFEAQAPAVVQVRGLGSAARPLGRGGFND